MNKILYALLLTIVFILGIASIFYGLFIFWKPVAFIFIGVVLVGVAYLLNQLYTDDSSAERRDK
ncbi:hypothetical protein [Staphylococcus argensis]|uniref:Uncharacterized protein n=1 Tax=Staphylococcus argensis TaxID=1607738 RepID=A0A2K4FDP6_9STAP|nr:hypothetical protein [Staphylococcus argensis]MCY6991206.1 dolichyl-diphosphooligosaccharide--protein glycosyltransferase subunit 2 [Staphylococcus argensis]POA09480.1 hypothetical protein CD039_01615 [Staphylococcus argensis]